MIFFAGKVKDEIARNRPKTTCCRKAFSLGLLYNATLKNGEKAKNISFTVSRAFEMPEVLDAIDETVGVQFHRELTKKEIRRLGRTDGVFSFESPKAAELLQGLSDSQKTLNETVGFKCPSCSKSFLSGLFISSATVSDPTKEYHLEFSIGSADKASKLYALMSKTGIIPKIINRKRSVGLYFKDSTSIEDLLTVMGATTSFFELTNAKIIRDISNAENRATNCVASNISKSISASQNQINAIYKLMEKGLFESLPEELQDTAKLRLDHAEKSLGELCSLHTPTISRSGLNHRLQRILDEAAKAEQTIQNKDAEIK